MAYDLDQFVSDCRDILKRDPGPTGRENCPAYLEKLLTNGTSSRPIAAMMSRGG